MFHNERDSPSLETSNLNRHYTQASSLLSEGTSPCIPRIQTNVENTFIVEY